MLLIIGFHVVRNDSTNFNQPLIIYLSSNILGIWGLLGVDIFIIISSWFLSEQKFSFRKIIYTVFQTFSWVLIFSLIYVFYDHFSLHHSLKITLVNILNYTINGFLQPFWCSYYWFITAYFFLLLLSPFLNKMLYKLKRVQIKKILIICVFIPLYGQFATSPVCDILNFIYIYLLIGYIKKYGSKIINKFSKKPFYFLIMILIILIRVLPNYFPKNIFFLNICSQILGKTLGYIGKHSIIILITAILIFFNTLNKRPKYNKIINKIASCCLGIYLFHENHVLGTPNVTNYIVAKLNFKSANLFYPIKLLGVILLIFIIGMTLEFIRNLFIQRPLIKRIMNRYKNKIEKIDNWFNTF